MRLERSGGDTMQGEGERDRDKETGIDTDRQTGRKHGKESVWDANMKMRRGK